MAFPFVFLTKIEEWNIDGHEDDDSEF